MKTNYQIMREVIEENAKHLKGAGDQIFEALKIKDKEFLEFIRKEYKCDPQGLYYKLIKQITGKVLKEPVIILDDNEISLLEYAREFPENWEKICESIDKANVTEEKE